MTLLMQPSQTNEDLINEVEYSNPAEGLKDTLFGASPAYVEEVNNEEDTNEDELTLSRERDNKPHMNTTTQSYSGDDMEDMNEYRNDQLQGSQLNQNLTAEEIEQKMELINTNNQSDTLLQGLTSDTNENNP